MAYSTEAQAVIDNMSALSVAEKDAIADFVDTNHAVGNWDMLDDVWCFVLNSTDRLVRWKSGTSASLVNTPTFDDDGVTTNGTNNAVDLGFAPDDGTQFADTDRQFSVFFRALTITAGKSPFGSNNGGGLRTGLHIQNTVPDFRIYGNYLTHLQETFTSPMEDILVSGTTLADTTTGYREDGVEIDSLVTGTPPAQAQVENLHLGCNNANGTLQNYAVLTVPFIAVGANSGFDWTTWNTSVNTLLSDLAPAVAYTLACDSGAFVHTGTAATLTKDSDKALVVDSGTFALAGTAATLSQGQTTWLVVQPTGLNYDANVAYPTSFHDAADNSHPVFISLHGTGQTTLAQGETVDAPTPLSEAWADLLVKDSDGEDWEMIIWAPFSPGGGAADWHPPKIRDVIADIVAHADEFKININKINVTGISLGAIGIHEYMQLAEDDSRYKFGIKGFYPMSGSNVQWLTDALIENAVNFGASIRGWYGEDDPNAWVTGPGSTSMNTAADLINLDQVGAYDLTEVPSPAAHDPAAWGVPYQDYSTAGIYYEIVQDALTDDINVVKGRFLQTGGDATFAINKGIGADNGAYAVAGQEATLIYSGAAGYSLSVDSGVFTQVGTAASLEYGRAIDAETVSYDLVGTAVGMLRGRLVGAGLGAYVLSGQEVTFKISPVIVPGIGTYVYTGASATLLYSGVGNKEILAESGAYVHSGTAASLLSAKKLAANGGTYGFVGTSSGLLYGRKTSVDVGAFDFVGNEISFLYGRALSPEIGSYLFTGSNAELIPSVQLREFLLLTTTITRELAEKATITRQLAETTTITREKILSTKTLQ